MAQPKGAELENQNQNDGQHQRRQGGNCRRAGLGRWEEEGKYSRKMATNLEFWILQKGRLDGLH